MSKAFVIGYDPGGNRAHGVAVLDVREENGRWNCHHPQRDAEPLLLFQGETNPNSREHAQKS